MAKSRLNSKGKNVPIIGLIGGIASGKSFVGNVLTQLGCTLVDADRIGHKLLDKPMIRQLLRLKFGAEIFDKEGSVNRMRLGSLVFGEGSEPKHRRAQLEEIMHPAIRTTAIQSVHRLRESHPPPLAIVIDAPLLIEAGWEPMCDWIFFVDAPNETRHKRAIDRGWSQQQWQAREQAQLSIDRKRQSATHIIPGNLPPDEIKVHLKRLLDEMHAASA